MDKSFRNILQHHNWTAETYSIYNKTEAEVERAINRSGKRTVEDFKALVSPSAAPYLEEMAQISHRLTQKRFGKTVQMYIPVYLSNECNNICTYCGFSLGNDIPRKTLSDEELLTEGAIIKQMGYDHILLVTGESNNKVGIDYLLRAVRLLRPSFSHISIEVQPLETEEYQLLADEGVNTVLVYQETYNSVNYGIYHPKGRKSNFEYRVETHDRLGQAGIHKMGLGALLGLEDWRTDSFFVALHLSYLERTYWKSKYSISFPRLRPCAGGIELNSPMTDRELTQLICAWRLFNEELELSMSTRESAEFRNNIVKLGITTFSAESATDPGGYANPKQNLEQFEIHDKRTTAQVALAIKSQGYEPVWKDWDVSLQ